LATAITYYAVCSHHQILHKYLPEREREGKKGIEREGGRKEEGREGGREGEKEREENSFLGMRR
jgi:hypothetical protein